MYCGMGAIFIPEGKRLKDMKNEARKYNWEDIFFPIIAFLGIIGFAIYFGFKAVA